MVIGGLFPKTFFSELEWRAGERRKGKKIKRERMSQVNRTKRTASPNKGKGN